MTKAIHSVSTYIPFIYFCLVSVTTACFNHIWFVKYRPYTDMCVLWLNTWMYFFVTTDKLLIKHILLYHLWRAVIFATYAFVINSIHDALFRDFALDTIDVGIFVGLLYVICVFIFAYVINSLHGLFAVHVLFMFFNVERKWMINLFVFNFFLIFYIANMFSKIERYQIDDVKLSRKPLLVAYQYLTLHQFIIPVFMMHIVLEYYLKEIIQYAQIDHDVFDVMDDLYKSSKKKIKTKVRFNDEVESFEFSKDSPTDSLDEHYFFSEEENQNENGGKRPVDKV